ncbi:MAG TPA: DUF3179 domain-containing protein, partial [Actinomycetota bacterium]|nr:DUF3179 domain-containing protein [Actinomycetota bacterium]
PAGPGPGRAGDRFDRAMLVDVLAPDQIPSIDDPTFIPPGRAAWVADRAPVASVEFDGDARAYPLQIMTRHEIVNDVIAGRPVAVTYCPLCNSAIAFDRRVGERTLEFGVSGKLYASDLVMYDRQTGSLWLQLTGESIQGPLAGRTLEVLPAQILSFAQWRRDHPNGRVLSRPSAGSGSYQTNPYVGYDRQPGPYGSFFDRPVDGRLEPMERVAGVTIDGVVVAYPYRTLATDDRIGAINDTVAGRPVAVFWEAGVASALDTERIADGRDVGTSGVFLAQTEGRRLTFGIREGTIRDRETGSSWTIGGRAVSGSLAGTRLEPVPHVDAFWFAWQAFYPESEVYSEG